MTIQLANLNLAPPVFLAPMAGVTDLPFRNLVQEFGAGLVVSEMVASQEMVQAKPGVRERAELGLNVENTAVQIAGRDPHWMAEAARQVEARGARLIDINMGCPAKKVTTGASGSALMKDLPLALSLIRAVVGAVSVPVSLKMRLGWDHTTLNAPELARQASAEGVQMITVHGRTRCQFYKGRADWGAIARVTETVDIPVVANGDINGSSSARTAMALSKAQGVMVGRGIEGQPWLLAQIAADVFGTSAPVVPTGNALIDLVSRHTEAALSFYGPHLGNRVMRKHLGWYMDHARTPAMLRKQILREADPANVLALLPSALGSDRLVAA